MKSQIFGETEFEYDLKHFKEVQKRFFSLTGITLSDSKDAMVYSRLARRVRKLGMKSFSQYLDVLNSDNEEQIAFINALTTNLTSFFREAHHFELLKQKLKSSDKPVSIWCAACSTGEEAYSIAITAIEARGDKKPNVRIIASDIDSDVLAHAKAGIYDINRIEGLPIALKKRFFYKGTGPQSGKVKVLPELSALIEFKKINLIESFWPIEAQQDFIFCRNVMIYFNKDTQKQVISRLINKLNPGGLYFAGHSESFSTMPNGIKSIGRTTYQKVTKDEK